VSGGVVTLTTVPQNTHTNEQSGAKNQATGHCEICQIFCKVV